MKYTNRHVVQTMQTLTTRGILAAERWQPCSHLPKFIVETGGVSAMSVCFCCSLCYSESLEQRDRDFTFVVQFVDSRSNEDDLKLIFFLECRLCLNIYLFGCYFYYLLLSFLRVDLQALSLLFY